MSGAQAASGHEQVQRDGHNCEDGATCKLIDVEFFQRCVVHSEWLRQQLRKRQLAGDGRELLAREQVEQQSNLLRSGSNQLKSFDEDIRVQDRRGASSLTVVPLIAQSSDVSIDVFARTRSSRDEGACSGRTSLQTSDRRLDRRGDPRAAGARGASIVTVKRPGYPLQRSLGGGCVGQSLSGTEAAGRRTSAEGLARVEGVTDASKMKRAGESMMAKVKKAVNPSQGAL